MVACHRLDRADLARIHRLHVVPEYGQHAVRLADSTIRSDQPLRFSLLAPLSSQGWTRRGLCHARAAAATRLLDDLCEPSRPEALAAGIRVAGHGPGRNPGRMAPELHPITHRYAVGRAPRQYCRTRSSSA